MNSSKQARRDAKQLFRSVLVNGVMDEARVRQAIQLLLDQRPRGYVEILTHLQRLVKLEIARRSARVESAIPLPPELQNSIRQQLTQRYGPGLNIEFAQNPAVIGGLRVQVGSDVYDGSIEARLQMLEESFSA
ncbi:MAG: F0F1 ATP synthase subunit delta [Verrucomicrobiota bacterium]|nr:F0F1 ATP synthase subunit delta [Verrucomicrobiota bacterium]